MKLEKKDGVKDKFLNRYFEEADEEGKANKETDLMDNEFSFETGSVVNEISAVKDPTVISVETTIHGNINADNDLEISGEVVGDVVTAGLIKIIGGSVTGNVKARKIFIKNSIINGNLDCESMIDVLENSKVTGNITGGDIVIDSICKGNVVASERLKLLERASVKGDIQSKVIKIEEGAKVDGKFKML